MKHIGKLLLTMGLAATVSVAVSACAGGETGNAPADRTGETEQGVLFTLQSGEPEAFLGEEGDACLVAASGALYRRTSDGWIQAEYEDMEASTSSLTVTYSDGLTGTYSMTADESGTCTHENLSEPVAVYPARCVIPGIGVSTCPVCHESFPVILSATGEHRYDADLDHGYTCIDCHVTDYFKNGQELEGDAASPDGYFVVKNVPDLLIEDGKLEIPGHIHGLPVIIGSSAFTTAEKRTLTNVTLDEGIVKIEANAFNGCKKLSSVTLPETLVEIGNSAFYQCGFTSVEIPASVEKIGEKAFGTMLGQLAKLTSVTFAENGNLREIGTGAFMYQPLGGELHIPASVETIGKWAFCWTPIEKLDFAPNSCLKTLGNEVFPTCESLTSVDLSNTSLTEIPYCAFSGCTALTNLTLPQGLKTIGETAFADTQSLSSVVIPASVEEIGKRAFGSEVEALYCGISSVTIEEGSQLTTIGDEAFYKCKNLTYFDLSPATNLDGSACNSIFYRCANLTTVKLPAIEEIGGMFYGCTGLKNIEYTDRSLIKKIENRAFEETGLEEFEIPENVEEIGYGVFLDTPLFENAENWTPVYDGAGEQRWEALIIDGVLTNLRKTDEAKVINEGKDWGKEVRAKYLEDDAYKLISPEGIHMIASRFAAQTTNDTTRKTFVKIVIPYTVQKLAYQTFGYNNVQGPTGVEYLCWVEFEDTKEHPSQLVSIDEDAFPSLRDGQYCMVILDYINIPDSVKHIGANIFWDRFPMTKKDERISGTSATNHYYIVDVETPVIKISQDGWHSADKTVEQMKEDHVNDVPDPTVRDHSYFYFADAERTRLISEFWYCIYAGVELWR